MNKAMEGRRQDVKCMLGGPWVFLEFGLRQGLAGNRLEKNSRQQLLLY